MKNLEILKLFPEPVLKYKFENFNDFNNELSNYIYNLYENDKEKKIIKSNEGGWHSPDFQISQKDTIQNKFALALQNIF